MLTHQTALPGGHSRQAIVLPGRAAAPVKSTHGSIELMGAAMSFGRNVEIYGENEPADYFYKVISGTVRTYKVLNDGRRQIGAFYLPGDIFGLEIGRRAHLLGRGDRRLQRPDHQAQHRHRARRARQRGGAASSGPGPARSSSGSRITSCS